MIIIGYQGIGKSTLARKRKDIIDLESSCFYRNLNGVKIRPDEWYIYYCQVALDLSKQGYTVFVSSHYKVREFLRNNSENEKIASIFPSVKLEKEWIVRLEERYLLTGLDKDFKALERAKEYFCEDIETLYRESMNYHLCTGILHSMHYDLESVVDSFLRKEFY